MNCLNPDCDRTNESDYPLCHVHALTGHFTNRTDCKCADCANARDLAEMPAGLRERLSGTVLLASSDDGAEVVRYPFTLDSLKPEYRLPVAQAISDLVKSVAKAA